MAKQQALTISAAGRLNVLQTKCAISSRVFHPTEAGPAEPFVTFQAIWDTGASATAVTQNVVDQLSLKPIAMVVAETAAGSQNTPIYLVNIILPNNVVFQNVHVSRVQIKGADVLIGMDIITTGDFAVTNLNGKTTMTFRCPSMTKIDFLAGANKVVGRNDPCTCGSGKKYKQFCGSAAA
jgi:spore maturation protein SpmB